MNAVAKANEDATEIELDNPASPVERTGAQPVAETSAPAKKRRGGRFLLMIAVPLALVAGGGYFWLTGGRYEETENANLRKARVTISSEAAGRIVEVNVGDNQPVRANDVLFVVDPEPYRIALAQADAALAAARMQVEQLRAGYSQAVAQEQVAAGELDYAKAQFQRSTDLAKKGISATSSLDEARRDLEKAEQERAAALQGIESAKAGLLGNPDIETDKHPTVLAALAARDKAAYNLAQTTVRAPADGIVAQAASFKVGQVVAAGTPLFSLVETGDTWVEANFKETQLTHLRPGQPAEVTLDTYPDNVLHGTVESVGAGTGAEFSLLPAQNATGNWVKVTQRVPVRVKLDERAAKEPLHSGLSATVTVDTGFVRTVGGLFGSAAAAQ
ncbi:HlyD family efflux transporter periplasmic adaptor subunit [Mesorhizobium sp. 10J20-29]